MDADSGQGDCLAPLAVNWINGKKRIVSAKGFFIEPGRHTINGRATLDATNCPFTDSNLRLSRAADLEVNFEAGKTCFLAYNHQAEDPQEWSLVVWKVIE